MMKRFITTFKTWYESRPAREKYLALGLTCAILYFFFNFLLFSPLEKKYLVLEQQLKTTGHQIKSWETQINALKSIAETPLYKKWQAQRTLFDNLQHKYKGILKLSPNAQWQDIIKTMLTAQKNITLVQIKHSPEALYHPPGLPQSQHKIYEQRLLLVFYSNYLDTYHYLLTLEEQLPNIHWSRFNYSVAQYPLAKVEMEFSIFYTQSVSVLGV